MGELSKLPNIGEVVEAQLNEAGIYTILDLKDIGSRAAWKRIKEIDDSACLHRLYSLEAAIEGIKKAELSPEKKRELKEFYQQNK